MLTINNTLSFRVDDMSIQLKGLGRIKDLPKRKDTAEISDLSKSLKKLDDFMNLGKAGGRSLDLSEMNHEEKEEFIKMLTTLIQHGIVGYEVLEIDGKPEKHDILMQIVDPRTRGAKLYRRGGYND